MPVLVFTGIVLAASAIVTSAVSAAQPTPTVSRTARPAVAGAPVEDPELAADTQLCLAMSSIVEDAALAIKVQGRSPDSALASRLRIAEARMGEHLNTTNARLGAASRAMRDAIVGLRRAVESGTGVAPATEAVISRIDDLDAACQTRLDPQPMRSAP